MDKELEDAENDMTEQKKAYSDLEYENQQTIRTLNALQQSQDELNRAYEQEIAAKDDLAKQMKELKKDYDFTRDQYESEVNAKSEMQKALSKSNTELNEWRQKYEEEAVVKNGQLEETNKGLVSELNTLGDEMLAAKSKILQLERVKVRYENDITDMTSDLETIQRKAATLDKKTTHPRYHCQGNQAKGSRSYGSLGKGLC